MSIGTKAIFRLDSDLYPNTLTGKNDTGVVLENGAFVEVGTIVDNELGRETYTLSKLSGEEGKIVGFVASPALMYDATKDERDFECLEGELIRTYIPNKSTVATFALKHFEGGASLAVGDKLCAKADGVVLAKVTSGEVAIAEVIAKEDFEGQESVVLRFFA